MTQENPQPLQGIRVLIVEDNFVLADSLRWALEGLGAEVAGPEPTCERALASLQEQAVDVAVLDIDLQGQSSAPIAESLQSMGRPFVFLTGFEDASSLPDSLQGARFLHKPVDPYLVADTVLELLKSSREEG